MEEIIGVNDRGAAAAHAKRAKTALDAAAEQARKGNNETMRDAYLRIAEIEAELARTSVMAQAVDALKDFTAVVKDKRFA